MKKIFASALIAALFLLPSVSSAKSTINDNDLGAIVAQSGSVTITFDDIYVKSKDLRTTSTDGLDWWNTNWDREHLVCNGDTCHADYFLEANSTSHNSDYEVQNSGAYYGYEVHVTGGVVKRSGSMILQVFTPDDDPTSFDYTNVSSQCRIDVRLINQRIEASIGIEAVIKLGTTSDLSGNQTLGRVYTAGVSATTNGHLTVYAHNNSLF